MKEIRDWRCWLGFLLLAGGILALLYACGDPAPDMTMQRWLIHLLSSLTVSAACFFGLYRLIRIYGNSEEDE